MKLRLFLWGLLVLLQGCTITQEIVQPDPAPGAQEYAPPTLEQRPVTYASNGSLYNQAYVMGLFQDRRAYRVGDMLTVSLDEKTSSTKQADTSFGKKSNLDYAMGGDLGAGTGSAEANRDFDGSAQSSQKNSLSGSITVLVYNVLPNGILQVRGEKWIKLNQGDEYLRLSGLVRVEDIDGMNRVSSQRLGDARITYSGKGTLAQSNEAGWMTKFFNSSWFPL